MNTYGKILLRLMIYFRRRLGYQIPQLNDIKPLRTDWWAIYRHHGRLIKVVALTDAEAEEVNRRQEELNQEYDRREMKEMDAWAANIRQTETRAPEEREYTNWLIKYEQDNERPEYHPCSKCVFSPETPGSVLPCPYSRVAGSARLACCTHKYEIIKDVEKI